MMSGLLAGRYDLGERIGSGGFGEVHVAVDRATGQAVAVKLLADTTREAAARFAREARLILQLAHPNTVRALDFGQTDTGPFLVLELLRGETLAARLRRGPLEPLLVTHVMRGLLGSLSEAHALGIVHRDVKPANVFLCEAPPGHLPLVKVLDFGIAKDPHSAGATIELKAARAALSGSTAPMAIGPGLTEANVLLGTPRYMAPEQITGAALGPPADVYAAGLIFAELLTGRSVFAGLSEITMMLTKGAGAEVPLPDAVKRSPYGALIQHATQVDPARRFANASEMVGALALANPAISAAPRFWRWVAAGVAVAGLVSGLAYAAFVNRAGTKDDRPSSRQDRKEEKEKSKREPKERKTTAEPSTPGLLPSPSSAPGNRERLGPRTVLYSGPVEIDEGGLVERLRKARFEVLEIDSLLVNTKRDGVLCIAMRSPAHGRQECLRVHKLQSSSTFLLVCHERGLHLLNCSDGRKEQPIALREFARAYGLDPDLELSER